jgi:carbamoyltransferase
MKILGIFDHFTSGAAVIVDGRVVAAISEERLVRKKMVMGFPWKAIEAVLQVAGLKPEDLDYVAVASQWGHFLPGQVDFSAGVFGVDEGLVKKLFFKLGSQLSPLRDKLPFLERLYYQLRLPVYARRREGIRGILRRDFGVQCPVEFIVHHYAHAASAYYGSGFDGALVVTLDGSGDGHSSHVYEVNAGKWTHLHSVPSFDGLGNYYAYVTHICGFTAGKHEGKITGLAAYGEEAYRNILERFVRYQDGTMVNVGNSFRHSAIARLREALPRDFSREDLAASVQYLSEDICTKYLAYWLKRTGKRKVALAGGVVANVKINQRIHEVPEVDELFIYPAMSDEGLASGAALALCAEKNPSMVMAGHKCFDHVYLGPEFTESQIEQALRAEGISFNRSAEIEKDIAHLIAAGYVVARVNGRMEFGPRALGNRSILYRPDDRSVNDWLNQRLRRTEFMPFAPSTLAEAADQCYVDLNGVRDAARFMTITFDCTAEMKRTCPGVVHIDGTARPQLVSETDNRSYYRIIKEFEQLTGLPSIVNTSFNIHEEPIVCTPQDAIRAFKDGHLDVLAMGAFLAKNADADDRVEAMRQAKATS